ncbi:hypothetical protein OPU71_20930 [Niveibacterium sp. 24ML]|uniref:hypothetical protein n=1 Tax=Niveibacterium sp. 24ML TaxID=2985512 RepID=UPI00227058BA|nr:hypothetical protein [Niveibacterium sp. 24ML]MCX9158585.1 hypothetical protein [Niveibacterium sp. 24ML]
MKKLLACTSLLLTAQLAMADIPPSDYLAYSDQLIREYHLLSNAPLPQVEILGPQLLHSQPPLPTLAAQYIREGDAFKKRDIEMAITRTLQSRLNGAPSRYVSFLYTLHLAPYDIDRRRFGVCFERECLDRRPYPIHTKLGTERYELAISDAPNRILFSPEEAVARQLEAVAAKFGRRTPALLVVEVTSTEEKQWSDKTPYRRVLSKLVGIQFLADFPRDPRSAPSAEAVLYSIWEK